MTEWLLLTATLPTQPSALRVRVWRALKATGAGALRDGVYLLPESAPSAPALRELERTIAEAGADAHLLVVQARDAAQDRAFRALFDRSPAYAGLGQQVKQARRGLKSAGEAELRKRLRMVEQQLNALRANDFFPDGSGDKAAAAVAALRGEVEARLSPDEPKAAPASIERLSPTGFQRRTWATRARPWIDRLASAWLVHRFVDTEPTFVWLADARKCPKQALGYDFDGARFSHVGERVTFEVIAASFGLDADPGIRRVGELVRAIDVGGAPLDETPGVELVVRGLQALHADDDALLRAALPLFDALYAASGAGR